MNTTLRILAFAALLGGLPPQSVADPISGDEEARKLSERMLETLGGRELWSASRTIRVELRGFSAREHRPWKETFWIDLEQPGGWFALRGGDVDRTIAWTAEKGWELSEGSLEIMEEDRHDLELEYWRRQPAVIFHRLARGGGGTRVAIADEGRRLEVFDTASGDLLAGFAVNLEAEPTKWIAKLGDREFDQILGPLSDFGEVRFPRWGADLMGRWRYEHLFVALLPSPIPVSLEPPESMKDPELPWSQGPPDPSPHRLTNLRDAYPVPSPDGSRVAFQSNRTGRFEIYSMQPDGSDVTQLTDAPGDNGTPTWSPDGKWIAFAANPDGASDIYLIRADGGEARRLTEHPGDDSHPHWSPDGERIFFNSARTTPDLEAPWRDQWHEVFSMRPDGTDLRQHTHCKAVCTYPSVSPDGTRITYRRITSSPGFAWDLSNLDINSEVFVADVDGSNEVNLSRSAAFDGWPVWSPDGSTILFSSNRAGPANVGQLYLIAADGTGLRRITEGPWSYVQPSWSPDGERIFAYQNMETADYEFGNVVVLSVPR